MLSSKPFALLMDWFEKHHTSPWCNEHETNVIFLGTVTEFLNQHASCGHVTSADEFPESFCNKTSSTCQFKFAQKMQLEPGSDLLPHFDA